MEEQRHTGYIPMVSVVMPSYNKEQFIEQAIRSVMVQTFEDWELIIVDDCSTDHTISIVEKLVQEDSRIHFYSNPRNMGAANTRNRGMELATGTYVALLDSDDVWYPEKLERQLAVARETGADIVYCSYEIIDENGQKKCDDFLVPEETDFEASLTKGVISCSTALLSRTVVDTYRFEPQFYHEDLAFWFKILRSGCIARADTAVLAQYRLMNGTRSFNKFRSARFRWSVYRNMLGFSRIKSVNLLLQYIVLGLIKYRRRTE